MMMSRRDERLIGVGKEKATPGEGKRITPGDERKRAVTRRYVFILSIPGLALSSLHHLVFILSIPRCVPFPSTIP